MKRNFFWIGALLSLSFLLASCCDNQHIEVNKDNIVFNSFGGTNLFWVVADCDWSIETNNASDWLTIEPLTGRAKDTTNVTLTAAPNEHQYDRSTRITIVSNNGKYQKEITVSQNKIDIDFISNKIWFLRTYERWDSNYLNVVIPESYRSWTYYTDFGNENWFFYFLNDLTGYEIRVRGNDTIYYPYDYVYYPEGDSLYVLFQNSEPNTKEDYHATIYELNSERFTFSDAYRPHQFEKLFLVNVSRGQRSDLKINPKKITKKPAGPLIQLK